MCCGASPKMVCCTRSPFRKLPILQKCASSTQDARIALHSVQEAPEAIHRGGAMAFQQQRFVLQKSAQVRSRSPRECAARDGAPRHPESLERSQCSTTCMLKNAQWPSWEAARHKPGDGLEWMHGIADSVLSDSSKCYM